MILSSFLTPSLVAPFVGAWIEINLYVYLYYIHAVAPFVGAWIEIEYFADRTYKSMSLRSSERGLKS